MNKEKNFSLPIHIQNGNSYIDAVNEKIDYYENRFNELLKMNHIKEKRKIKYSLKVLKKQKGNINYIFNKFLSGELVIALEVLKKIIEKNKKILVFPINKANAFKGNPIHTERTNSIDSLYLVRGRIVDSYQKLNFNEMFHIPLDQRSKVNTYRYSIPGVPALYLACNSYTVWNELNNPNLENLAISYLNCEGILQKKIIDISLMIDEYYNYLIKENYEDIKRKDPNKIDFIIETMKIIPLIIACSVVCDDKNDRYFKEEYVFPQLLMQLLDKNCIGIAYRSMRIEKANIISNNLAIPILDFEKNKKYGNIVNYISVSDSLNIGYFNNMIYNTLNLRNTIQIANGPGAKIRKNVFDTNPKNITFTFNKKLMFDHATYDKQTFYKDSIFYYFDEYLLFLYNSNIISNDEN